MRARLTIAGALCGAMALLISDVLRWLAVTPFQERGTDFSASYVAALLLRSGRGARLYDQALEQSRHLALLPAGTHITLPFVTPPTTALIALPFTALPLDAAARVFSLVQVGCLVAAVVLAARTAPWPRSTPAGARAAVVLVAVAGVPTLSLLLLAQFDGLCALGVALAYAAWRRGRLSAAGVALALGLLTVKPHLALGLAVFLVARREWAVLRGAAAATGVLALTWLLLGGPAVVGGFARALGYSLAATPPASTVGVAGFLASWLGAGTATAALSATGAAACAVGCALLGHRSRGRAGVEVPLAGALALSLALSPHLFPYDLVVLAPALVWCMARAAARDGAPWPGWRTLTAGGAWLLANLAVALDTGSSSPAPPGRLTPLALLAAAAIAVAVTARARSGPPAGMGAAG